jgi:hypothetical protein
MPDVENQQRLVLVGSGGIVRLFSSRSGPNEILCRLATPRHLLHRPVLNGESLDELRLLVTKIADIATACAAIMVSITPIGVPLRSRPARISANASAAASSHAKVWTPLKNLSTSAASRCAWGRRRTPNRSSARVTAEMHICVTSSLARCESIAGSLPLIT